jgi:tetratricopeptide (TPR) repeat protein
VAVGIPRLDQLPDGPLRDLVIALHQLYRAAGKPGVRVISTKIKERNDLRDTVSHETISAMLRGRGLPRWVKVECVVRQLAEWTVDETDPDRAVRRFHGLWLAASDALGQVPADPPTEVSGDFVGPPHPGPAGSEHPGAVNDVRARSVLITNLGTRNSRFTGREDLLDMIRAGLSGTSQGPLVLHGVGGAGKTQLAIEYANRRAGEFDLLWWIPAEQPSQIVTALAALGERLDLPDAVDRRQTARSVIEALETSSLRWLLIYDNAEAPEETASLVPAAGGRVIVTSRNSAWTSASTLVEVGVFTRAESMQFLQRHASVGSARAANELAERLGDLPLALDQVSRMQAATGMPISEYLRLFAEHMDELLGAGRPTGSGTTVATLVNVAFGRLRAESPAAAQLLELLAFMAPVPVSLALLRGAPEGVVSPPLGRALPQPVTFDRVVGLVTKYGLARLDREEQRIEVHRLVQLVLRESLLEDAARRVRLDVHRLLAGANAGNPDDPRTWGPHAEIGPHLIASDAVRSDHLPARQAVLDQVRYLERVGDFEASARLAQSGLDVWRLPPHKGGLGWDDELTVLATRHLANARRALGHYDESQRMITQLLDRLKSSQHYGPDHPHTLDTAAVASFFLRLTGAYHDALATDRDQVERRLRRDGETSPRTLAAMANLSVNLRLTGDAVAAFEFDSQLVAKMTAVLGPDDPRTLFASGNLARDLYELGRYGDALDLQRRTLAATRQRFSRRHLDTVRTAHTVAIALRKAGRYHEAMLAATENYQESLNRFGPDHEATLAAMMAYANSMRVIGDAIGARSVAAEALSRYRRLFGERNPLTLAAATNYAVVLRALGRWREAHRIDEITYDESRETLDQRHPYTLAAAVGLATDLAHDHEPHAAADVGRRTLDGFRGTRGDRHPDTWICAANLAVDLVSAGARPEGEQLAVEVRSRLVTLLGEGHPEISTLDAGRRLECDIEPPPT